MTEQNGDGDHSDEYLFDPTLLQSVLQDYSLKDSKLCGKIYDNKYLLRPLIISDYNHGFVDLLRQLTECGTITYDDFKKRFHQMKQSPNTYYILVMEDSTDNKQIIGTATLVCEKKFLRQLGIRGRIEDVVIHRRCRGQQLGKLMLNLLTQFARDKCDCYKISLECKDHLVTFYQQFGFNHEDKQNFLCQRFKNLSTNQ